MFLPQVVTAITASLLGAGLARRFSLKRVFLTGLLADLASMGLLVTSQFFTSTQAVAYGLLLVATAALGAGFGLVVPALNTFTAAFHPDRVDKSILTLNALLGLGTALAPVFVALFLEVGSGGGCPSSRPSSSPLSSWSAHVLPLHPAGTAPTVRDRERPPLRIPPRFWLFAAFAILYGICETINGNWSQTLMAHLGASATTASLALTTFWVMVTLGRVLFALLQRAFPTPRTYHVCPSFSPAPSCSSPCSPRGRPRSAWSPSASQASAARPCSLSPSASARNSSPPCRPWSPAPSSPSTNSATVSPPSAPGRSRAPASVSQPSSA